FRPFGIPSPILERVYSDFGFYPSHEPSSSIPAADCPRRNGLRVGSKAGKYTAFRPATVPHLSLPAADGEEAEQRRGLDSGAEGFGPGEFRAGQRDDSQRAKL